MSTNPEPLKISLRYYQFTCDASRTVLHADNNEGTYISITGPSRERIASHILHMDKAVEALRRIASYLVHSEPVGGAMEMQDIAVETLKQIEA